MTEQAGWDVAGQLPPSIARRLAQADARDAIAAREAAEARELRATLLALPPEPEGPDVLDELRARYVERRADEYGRY